MESFKVNSPFVYNMNWYDIKKEPLLIFWIVNSLTVNSKDKITEINEKYPIDGCRPPLKEELKKYFNK